MQIEHIITHEAQLDGQLANSIHNAQRSDFALLLAMLSDDATEFSQFRLVKSSESHFPDTQFNIAKQSCGPCKPLAASPFNGLIGQHNARLLLTGGLQALSLNECLNPEPLCTKNDAHYISPLITNNCPPATQKKLLSQHNVAVASNKIDVDGFYQSIEKSQNRELTTHAQA